MNLSSILVNSGAKFRKEILAMPVAALQETVLKHMTLHTGVAGDETVGALGSGAQIRPYKTEKGASDSSKIAARTLTTYLGDVVEEFDPYVLFTTVYGEQFTSHTTRTDAEIVKDLSMQMAKSVSKNLALATFSGVRNATGTTTLDLFNGFDTITATEISAGNIAVGKGNLFEYHSSISRSNAGDILKSIYDAASDELIESEGLRMYVPRAVKRAYDDWYLDNFGAVQYNNAYGRKYLHGTEDNPCEIVALSAQKNSSYIYLSTKSNMLVGCSQDSEREQVEIRKPDNPKVVQFFMCLFWGVQFQMIEPEYLLVAKYVAPTPDPVVITGDASLSVGADAGSNNRTYATSNGAAVTAEVKTEGADWLSVAVAADGHKVTFTRTAFAYDAEGTSPRTATVRISCGSVYKDVTVSQEMAANV